LKEGNSLKTKEMLSLERGIEKNKKRADHFVSETEVLALENRRLSRQINRERQFVDNPDQRPVRGPL
jgi:regulator of replication initiation timing